MSHRKWIHALVPLVLAAGTVLVAQTPIIDFDQTATKWVVLLHSPGVNEFSLTDTTDAYQGAGSLKVTAKFLTFPSNNQAFGTAEYIFSEPLNISGADEIRFRIKILSPSTVNRSMQWFFEFTDKPEGAAENERWMYGPDYDIPYIPADSAWHMVVILFSRLYRVPDISSVNGLFDKESVVSLGFDLRGDGTAPDSIRFLIDDLIATKTVQEFQLVSFDDVNPGNGWQSNELNPWELTIDTENKYEGAGSLDVMMDIREFEDWGAEAEVGWGHEAPGINLTGITELRFRIHVLSPPTMVHATRFYLWFLDQPEGEANGEVWTTYPTYSVMTDEDKNGYWNEVVVPMDQFVFASWNADNGTVNNEVFDLDAIVQTNLNVGADNPPGEPDAVEFLIDDLWATTGDATTVGVTDRNAPQTPEDFRLEQNAPNPFNPTTFLHYRIARSGRVHLNVFDCRGKLVKTLVNGETRSPGSYSMQVNLSDQPSGIYFYSLEQDGRALTRKMTLLK
jgi:hypothetical protein